jgi:hypothetical protein
MKDTRKRGRQKKPKTTLTKERERERANGSLSAFTHFFSLHSLFLLSRIIKEESKERGKLSVTFYISLLYKSR